MRSIPLNFFISSSSTHKNRTRKQFSLAAVYHWNLQVPTKTDPVHDKARGDNQVRQRSIAIPQKKERSSDDALQIILQVNCRLYSADTGCLQCQGNSIA